MSPYAKIFRQAWELTIQRKFLWGFGLFLVLGNLFNLALTQNWVKPHPAMILPFAILIVIYFWAKAGSILAIKALLDKQETSFKKAWSLARWFYGRLFVVSLLMNLTISITALIISVPVFYLFAQKLRGSAIVLSLLGLGILIPVLVVALLIDVLGALFVVMFDLKIKEAINSSFDLISKHWLRLVGLGLLLVGLIILVLFFGAFMIILLSNLLGIWGLLMGGLAFFLVHIILTIFVQISWVLVFLDLVKPQKFEQDEVLPMPELV